MSFNSSSNNDAVKTKLGGAKSRGFRIKKSNKLKALGETNFKSHLVTINTAWHKIGNPHRPSKTRKIPEILKTRVHETEHVRHPKMREHTVQKVTNRKLKKLSAKQKKKIYNKNIIK